MIQRFDSNVTVNSNPLSPKNGPGWLSVVVGYLLKIDGTKTGKCLFREIRRTHKQFVIRPWTSPDINSDSGPLDGTDQELRDGYYKYRPVRNGEGSKVGIGYGTGKGCDVEIRYTPWRFSSNEQAAYLLHEFVHGIKFACGVEYANSLSWAFDTAADFDTVLVEDMFRSETHTWLRQNHSGDQVLNGKMIPQPEAYKRRLRSFKARLPVFVADLARLDVPFNPYRPGKQGYVKL